MPASAYFQNSILAGLLVGHFQNQFFSTFESLCCMEKNPRRTLCLTILLNLGFPVRRTLYLYSSTYDISRLLHLALS